MRYGVSLPILGEYNDPRLLAELARDAEAAGWDGVFVWDLILVSVTPPMPLTDPWIALTAMALSTERIKLGPMVTPLARRNPYVVAREAITLDHLSGGRVILGVGLGTPPDMEFGVFGEEVDPKVRARKLDEGLDIVVGLCSGEPFGYDGEYYQVPKVARGLKTLQQPRIPVWVASWWPNKAPIRRAARWDGSYPVNVEGVGTDLKLLEMVPNVVQQIQVYIAQHRSATTPFDVVVGYHDLPDDPTERVQCVHAYADAGATWLMQETIPWETSLAQTQQRIRQGPPRI